MPWSRLNSPASQSTIALSKLSPPRWLSPAVDYEDRLVGLLVEPVGQRGRGRLVDDALDLEAGDAAGVLGRLALVVVEVGGDGDDRCVDRLAEIGLGLGVLDHGRLAALEDGHARVRGAEVDPDGLCHVCCSSTRSQSL